VAPGWQAFGSCRRPAASTTCQGTVAGLSGFLNRRGTKSGAFPHLIGPAVLIILTSSLAATIRPLVGEQQDPDYVRSRNRALGDDRGLRRRVQRPRGAGRETFRRTSPKSFCSGRSMRVTISARCPALRRQTSRSTRRRRNLTRSNYSTVSKRILTTATGAPYRARPPRHWAAAGKPSK
jgi:hypothetical protein